MDIGLTGPALPPAPNSGEEALRKRLERMARDQNAGAAPAPGQDKALRHACEEFESFLIYMLMKEMRKTVPETPFLHGGRAEEIFRDLMDEEMSKRMAHTPGGGIGIADMLYRQLSRRMVAKPADNTSSEEQAAPRA